MLKNQLKVKVNVMGLQIFVDTRLLKFLLTAQSPKLFLVKEFGNVFACRSFVRHLMKLGFFKALRVLLMSEEMTVRTSFYFLAQRN